MDEIDINDKIIELCQKRSKQSGTIKDVQEKIVDGIFHEEYDLNKKFYLREKIIKKINETRKTREKLLNNLDMLMKIEKENKGINCDSLILKGIDGSSFFRKQKEKINIGIDFETNVEEVENKKNRLEDIQWKINQIYRVLLSKNMAHHKMELFEKELENYQKEFLSLNIKFKKEEEFNQKLQNEVDKYETEFEKEITKKIDIISNLKNEVELEKEKQEKLKTDFFEKKKINLVVKDENKELGFIDKEVNQLKKTIEKTESNILNTKKNKKLVSEKIEEKKKELDKEKLELKNYILNNEEIKKNKKKDVDKYFYFLKALEEDKKDIVKETSAQRAKNIYLTELIENQKEDIKNLDKKISVLNFSKIKEIKFEKQKLEEDLRERIDLGIFKLEEEIKELKEKLEAEKIFESDISEKIVREKISESIQKSTLNFKK
jgi:hypothetical protein